MRNLGLMKEYVLALLCAILIDLLIVPVSSMITTTSAEAATWAALGLVIIVAGGVALHPLLNRAAKLVENSLLQSALLAIILAFTGAALTDFVGMHMMAGAFFAGMVTPMTTRRTLGSAHDKLGHVLILSFFVTPGLMLDVELGSGALLWLSLALIVFAGIVKVLGVYLATRLANIPRPEAFVYGYLLNCRGIVEIAIGTTFVSAGKISDEYFAAIVLMTVVLTAITAPAVMFCERHRGKNFVLSP
jgi:Kef-type K+ transport system membrane component KefB